MRNLKKTKPAKEENLKGTFVSVMSVGVIIIVMWVVVYYMYVAR
ncbi:MAG: cytochrome C oxidase subunit II [Planococcaceae bacterium]|nr:cytochrome C oxidase subunit II [Planococcaceae bacterium]